MRKRLQPGYYPGYSTLDQKDYWDAATRRVVIDRVENTPPIRFFSIAQAELMEAICDHIIPQHDRDDARRIPIVPYIDKRLHEGHIPGYRYHDMPPDEEAYPLLLEAIEKMASETHGRGFLELDLRQQDELLKSIHDAKPSGAADIWSRLPVHRAWQLLVQDCIEAYYAHPWAWDEVGFGGPAYPRAYTRLENGEAEPWEQPEKPYFWDAPEWAVSDTYEPGPGAADMEPMGQEGTH
jgi:hypothetical protein